MTPEERTHINTIMSKIRNQTYTLDSVVNEFRDDILRDGFRPHLTQIMQSVQRLCKSTDRVPFTILSKMPNAIDYMEPLLQDRSGERFLSICLSLRNLVNNGLTEALYVFSEASLPQANARRHGRVHVRWVSQNESLHHVFQVLDGRSQRAVRILHEVNRALTLIFNPWNTNTELFEFLGIPKGEHPDWAEFIAKGMEETKRVIGLIESQELQTEEPESHETK